VCACRRHGGVGSSSSLLEVSTSCATATRLQPRVGHIGGDSTRLLFPLGSVDETAVYPTPGSMLLLFVLALPYAPCYS
jgi:hypothetical protein